MSISWSAKVEYYGDKTEAIVDASWILDFDDCPAYDPHRIYRGFWSPIDADTPEIMLKRVPCIPTLSEEEEKKGLPGYYKLCILGVQDDPKKFEEIRSRKSTQRGSKPENGSKKQSKKPSIQKKKSSNPKTSDSEKSSAPESKAKTDAKKSRAVQSNVGIREQSNIFQKLDNDTSGDFDSDDSESDPTLVSANIVKVLKTSVKNLKMKLLEKCHEVDEVQKKLTAKEAELDKVRILNTNLQEKIIDLIPSFGFPKHVSLSSSRSSSTTSSRASSYERLPVCPRSRSVSGSSVSSCASTTTLSHTNKRKTPPTSPNRSLKKTYDGLVSPAMSRIGNSYSIPKLSGLIHTAANSRSNGDDINDSPISKDIDTSFLGDSMDEDLATSPLKQQNSMDSSSVTIMNSSTHSSLNTDDPEKSAKSPEGKQLVDTSQANETNTNLVLFCQGFMVDKEKLKKIENRSLSKTEDGSYVKELAVLVFSHKTLYNSSIKERKYNKNGSKDEEENKRPRKMLDVTAVEEIRARLQSRVEKEYKTGTVPDAERDRYSKAKVNAHIYDKIKKMRRNPNLKELEDSALNESM